MKIFDNIFPHLRRKSSVVYDGGFVPYFDGSIGHEPYGDCVFRNIVEILTDLCNDVEWVKASTNVSNTRFVDFRRFFENEATKVLWHVFRRGYAVIGVFADGTLRMLKEDEYSEVSGNDVTEVLPRLNTCEAYVMKSDTFAMSGVSDYSVCRPFVELLDNTLNASNTLTKRMGAFVVGSPETPNGSPTLVKLSDDEKERLEKDIARDYGALREQRQFMLLPRSMKFQQVSLVGIDTKMPERARMAILAICDRVKVPANQVAIIDANSSKALSNGSEMREGDFAKYQSFERLLNHTFVRMASELGMKLTYTIYNKPTRAQQQEQ